jgi:hypothetical protein
MKTRAKSQAFLPASPLTARGEDEGEGFQTGAKLNAANPHPTLSLGKREADQGISASKDE